MRIRIAAVMAAVALLSICAGVGRGQAAAQPKPLVNADIVKMVKAGLTADTIVLTIQNKPSAFETGPDELIRLKQQGVPQVVLNAMLSASNRATGPAAQQPPPQQPAQQMQPDQGPEGAWVAFYSTCPKGDLVYFNATIYANNVELARMKCNTYF
ncbi:MAG: hypothetical protein ABSC08_02435 [Bryobacteraceae bacterium]